VQDTKQTVVQLTCGRPMVLASGLCSTCYTLRRLEAFRCSSRGSVDSSFRTNRRNATNAFICAIGVLSSKQRVCKRPWIRRSVCDDLMCTVLSGGRARYKGLYGVPW
jgi:hypothetical protein